MGDRGQIKIKMREYNERTRKFEDTGKAIFLYTHSTGYRLKSDLKKALVKKWSWEDSEYLTRIIFDVMTEEAYSPKYGFGIGIQKHDDLNNSLLVVDCKNKTVTEISHTYKIYEKELNKWTFEEFIKEEFADE